MKVGLLDYIVRTLQDPAFVRDIWLVPVGINYDRVLEDRSLIRERIVGGRRPSRWRQLIGVVSYLGWNTLRLLTGQLKRYGRVAVAFGTPISVRGWLGEQPDGVLELPKQERLPHIQRLPNSRCHESGAVIPVTPVPLAAAALLSFASSVVPRTRLLDRMDEIRDRLATNDAKVVRSELPITEVWERAWLMLSMRRLVLEQGNDLVILPSERPLLEYYANSIRQFLPSELKVSYSPVSRRRIAAAAGDAGRAGYHDPGASGAQEKESLATGPMTRLLLLSNGINPGSNYLAHAFDPIRALLGREVREVLFVPYAAVERSVVEYREIVGRVFEGIGYQVASVADARIPRLPWSAPRPSWLAAGTVSGCSSVVVRQEFCR